MFTTKLFKTDEYHVEMYRKLTFFQLLKSKIL